jgi:hypothetical protein
MCLRATCLETVRDTPGSAADQSQCVAVGDSSHGVLPSDHASKIPPSPSQMTIVAALICLCATTP